MVGLHEHHLGETTGGTSAIHGLNLPMSRFSDNDWAVKLWMCKLTMAEVCWTDEQRA